MEFLRNTIMLGLTDQRRIRIRSRKKNEENSEKIRSKRRKVKTADFSTGRACGLSHRPKLRTFCPALIFTITPSTLLGLRR
jgi:hypothetical protein